MVKVYMMIGCKKFIMFSDNQKSLYKNIYEGKKQIHKQEKI